MSEAVGCCYNVCFADDAAAAVMFAVYMETDLVGVGFDLGVVASDDEFCGEDTGYGGDEKGEEGVKDLHLDLSAYMNE